LQWQTFWESFTATVDSNPCLSQFQKLNYLHAQLQEDAACVISGLPLTDSNYAHSVTLLRERIGQQYKLVDAHMEALLNMPPHQIPRLVLYDTIQGYIRSLSALGKSWYAPNFCNFGKTVT